MRYPFYFDDRLAGEFVDGFPRRPGCYVYTPNEKVKESMRQRLMERGAVECYYNDNDGRVFFNKAKRG